MESPFKVLSLVARILEQQQINYVLVGSLASSIHGMYRSTADIDIVADVRPAQVIPLLAALQGNFYVDEQRLKTRSWRSFAGLILAGGCRIRSGTMWWE